MEIYDKIYKYICNITHPIDSIITCYNAKEIPPISIEKYIIRLYTYSNISDISHVCSLILLDRIINILNINLNIENFHRLYCMSLRISSKVFDDFFIPNSTFAPIVGLNLQELNLLEQKYLVDIQWNIFIDSNTYFNYINQLAP